MPFSVRKTTKEFIDEAKSVHGDRYLYDKVEYLTNRDKVCITCRIHGDFWQNTCNHLKGHGWNLCAIELNANRKTIIIDEFLLRAKDIHGDKYDYSLFKYNGCHIKSCIICPIHGCFNQTPTKHLTGRGCPHCGKKLRSYKK